jgi:arylamine N-acetyltransferase
VRTGLVTAPAPARPAYNEARAIRASPRATSERTARLGRRYLDLLRVDHPVPPVDLDALLASWEERSGGGVCFEHAAAFDRLLAELGYRVQEVLGAITFPGSHQAVVVELDGARALVDVGNGAPFLEPIPLDRTVEIHRARLSYRFGPDGTSDGWLQERRIDGAWVPFCRYALAPPDAAAGAAAYQRHHTVGETWVLGSLTLIRSGEQEVFVLRNDELSHFTEGGKRTDRVDGPAAHARLASDVFRLPALPIEAGLAAWRANTARSAPP